MLIAVITVGTTVLAWAFGRNIPEEMGWPRITEATEVARKEIGFLEGATVVRGHKHFWPLAVWFFFSYRTVIGFGRLTVDPISWRFTASANLRLETSS